MLLLSSVSSDFIVAGEGCFFVRRLCIMVLKTHLMRCCPIYDWIELLNDVCCFLHLESNISSPLTHFGANLYSSAPCFVVLRHMSGMKFLRFLSSSHVNIIDSVIHNCDTWGTKCFVKPLTLFLHLLLFGIFFTHISLSIVCLITQSLYQN